MNIPENMKEITDLASQLVKEESSTVNSILPQDNLFVNMGWQCPICKRVYSPFTHMCMYCGNREVETITLPKLPNTVGLAQEQNNEFKYPTPSCNYCQHFNVSAKRVPCNKCDGVNKYKLHKGHEADLKQMTRDIIKIVKSNK